jgi:hypothetical protein
MEVGNEVTVTTSPDMPERLTNPFHEEWSARKSRVLDHLHLAGNVAVIIASDERR